MDLSICVHYDFSMKFGPYMSIKANGSITKDNCCLVVAHMLRHIESCLSDISCFLSSLHHIIIKVSLEILH